jgi:polyhydroxyalkanoate synthesis regulator phasin
VLKRANELSEKGENLFGSKALLFFLKNNIDKNSFSKESLEVFSKLDDNDIISALKEWRGHEDFVLSNLCQMILDRELLKVKIKNKKIKDENFEKHIDKLIDKYKITKEEATYFVFKGEISNQAYQRKTQRINILFKTGKVSEIVKASDHLNLKVLSKRVTKYYICYPKEKL